MERRTLQADPTLPFCDGVIVGDTLYLSGRIGFVPGTMTVPDTPEQEATYLLDGLRDVLARALMRMEDLVYVQIFSSDLSLWERFNAIYTPYFSGDVPARAFLGAKLLFGARFELQAIAVATSPVP